MMMADIAHVAGLIAVGLYPSPVNIADVTTSTTHKTLRGPRGGLILAKDPAGLGSMRSLRDSKGAIVREASLLQKLNSAVFPGTQGGPLMHVIAAKAVAFKEALEPSFKTYQQQIRKNAAALANALIEREFVLFSGGTDNHLMLIDLRPQQLTGKK